MTDFTKEAPNNVSLIFDVKKDVLNYSWFHYLEHPEMKKFLVNKKIENGYILRDIRTDDIVLSASFCLEKYLK